MKHTLTRFEMNLYEWNFWTTDVVAKFAAWLKENGETRVDKFQSTHPRRVRPAFFVAFMTDVLHFNPRTREGCDGPLSLR